MRARRGQGLENRAAVMRAEAGRAAAAAELAAIDEQIALTRNRLAALVGAADPSAGLAIALPGAARLGVLRPARRSRHRHSRPPAGHRRRAAPRRGGGRAASRRRRPISIPNVRLSALIGLQALGIGNLLLDGGSSLRLGRTGDQPADLLGRADPGRLSRRPRRI